MLSVFTKALVIGYTCIALTSALPQDLVGVISNDLVRDTNLLQSPPFPPRAREPQPENSQYNIDIINNACAKGRRKKTNNNS